MLVVADEGKWPQSQLQKLLNYLHLEVLRQIMDEEWLLFRDAQHAPAALAMLRRDHLELRLGIDVLTRRPPPGAEQVGCRLSNWPRQPVVSQ